MGRRTTASAATSASSSAPTPSIDQLIKPAAVTQATAEVIPPAARLLGERVAAALAA
jgi:hypothetical protein